jgi:hypothetical protein
VLNEAPRHEDVLGSGGIAPRILNPGTRWRWVVSFTPRPLYPRSKSPPVAIGWYHLQPLITASMSLVVVIHPHVSLSGGEGAEESVSRELRLAQNWDVGCTGPCQVAVWLHVCGDKSWWLLQHNLPEGCIWAQTPMLNELCFWTLSIVWCLKNKQNWGKIKIIDKRSQYTRPQTNHTRISY